MRTILITGGAGFVGLNLVEALLGRGDHVVVFGRELGLPPEATVAFEPLPGRLDVIQGDVLDEAALRDVFSRFRPDGVLPFAAVTAGPVREATSPRLVVDTNFGGVIATLQAARDQGGVRRVVLPSSAAVYGEAAYTHAVLDEVATPCAPISLYGVTKFSVERGGLRLAGLWELDAVAARIGATFGPWERDTGMRDTLSPHLALARVAVRGGEAVLPQAPLPAYDWVYVRDLVGGLLALLDHAAPPHRVVNLASGTDWSGAMLPCCAVFTTAFPAFHARHAVPGEAPSIIFQDVKPRGVMSVARAGDFGWQPRFSPLEAYADYAEWLAKHPQAA